ncbi:DUF6714 family protein [Gynuella sp.]|uniref:DUF6714 family protein n=1 Tax=Gynuella sp. TaxID=2969146 RepID=UPI003D106D37
MMTAELIIIQKIRAAFSIPQDISDEWITRNTYIFETVDAKEAINYLPIFMIWVLNNHRANPQSSAYIHLLQALNEYSKCKRNNNPHLNLWHQLNKQQKAVVRAFLKHLLENQSANIDRQDIQKILDRFAAVE